MCFNPTDGVSIPKDEWGAFKMRYQKESSFLHQLFYPLQIQYNVKWDTPDCLACKYYNAPIFPLQCSLYPVLPVMHCAPGAYS